MNVRKVTARLQHVDQARRAPRVVAPQNPVCDTLQFLQKRMIPQTVSFTPIFSREKVHGCGQVPKVHVLTLAEQSHDVPPVVRGCDMLRDLLGSLDRGARHASKVPPTPGREAKPWIGEDSSRAPERR